jgi:hypothetical protein
MEEGQGPVNFSGEAEVPTVYADAANLQATQFTVTLVFGKRGAPFKEQERPKAEFVVHMSPEFGLQVADLFKRWVERQQPASEDGSQSDG